MVAAAGPARDWPAPPATVPYRELTHTMSSPLLFEPLSLRGLRLKNRIVVAPMHQYAAVKGMPQDWHLMNAGRYAAGGAGLFIIESTKIERRGCGTVGDLGLWDDRFVAPLRHLADFTRACGAAVGIQLGHSGRKARVGRPWEGGKPLDRNSVIDEIDDWDDWELVAPSAIAADARSPVPRALSKTEIHQLAEDWGRATARAHAAGIDAVELHGAHGFLIHQFLNPNSNQRSDEYGGSLPNRMRFAIEVTEAARAQWPQDKPLFMRLSVDDGAGWDAASSVALAQVLKTKGVDVIDCSGGGMLAGALPGAPVGYGYQVPYADQLRREAGIATMAVGLIVHAEQAEAILQAGQADLIALARELIYNPNWAMDAAQKFGLDPHFSSAPPAMAYWLERRLATVRGVLPSTHGAAWPPR
jgi:2,4-dienoyl-CoA reductase-like NADH-dependent reductase (Old Yellow Enzyme family)